MRVPTPADASRYGPASSTASAQTAAPMTALDRPIIARLRRRRSSQAKWPRPPRVAQSKYTLAQADSVVATAMPRCGIHPSARNRKNRAMEPITLSTMFHTA